MPIKPQADAEFTDLRPLVGDEVGRLTERAEILLFMVDQLDSVKSVRIQQFTRELAMKIMAGEHHQEEATGE